MEFLKKVEGRHERISLPTDFKFDKNYDIAVVGMGTAGAIAVITAAKSKLRVVGIDRLNGLGGIGTLGGVFDYYFGNTGGEYEQYNTQCLDMTNKLPIADPNDILPDYSMPGMVKDRIMTDEAASLGADLMFDTVVCGVYMENDKVCGIECIQDSKLTSIGAKAVIDSSGNSIIADYASLPVTGARDWDNLFIRFSKPVLIYHEGKLRGMWHMCGNIDEWDADSVSKRIIYAYTLHPLYYETYKDHKDLYPFECTILGTRQSHRIVAEDSITFDDFKNGRTYDKPLFYAFSTVDTATSDIAFDNPNNTDWRFLCGMQGKGFSQPVEVGALIPKGIKGMLVAGKGAGTDCDVSGLLRMKRDLEKCGEAVATIAIEAVRQNIDVTQVSYESIEAKLRSTGCLDEANNFGLCKTVKRTPDGFIKLELLTEKEAIYDGLAGNSSLAMWSAVVLKNDEKYNWLHEWLNDGNEKVVNNSAVVLGVLGDKAAMPVLRHIVCQPDEYSRLMIHKAICLEGRFCDEEVTLPLLYIIRSFGENLKRPTDDVAEYTKFGLKPVDSVRFAAVALYNICKDTGSEVLKQELSDWCSGKQSEDEEIAYTQQSVLEHLKTLN